MKTVYDFNVKDRSGNEISLAEYRGKVLLIVNTATGCGFTPHYEPLEAMYKDLRDKGLEILDFPCNQFANQAPGSGDEIHEFCTLKFGAEFPQFAKTDVNGETADPLFAFLAAEKPFAGFGKGIKNAMLNRFAGMNNKKYGDKAYIKWNFTKFLIDREGNVEARFEPTEDMKNVRKAVEEALARPFGPAKAFAAIFENEPETWGLRGDPYFWRYLKERASHADPVPDAGSLEDWIKAEYLAVSGKPLTELTFDRVEQFAHGGMSSGGISGEWWFGTGIPLLKERLEKNGKE